MKRDDLTEALRFPRVTLLLQNPHVIFSCTSPAFDSDTAFFRFVFFRPVDDDKLITRVRQQHETRQQPEQEARDCPNPFFWYATVYALPAQALAMFAPNVFPLSGAFCLNKRLRHRLGRNSIGTLAKKLSCVETRRSFEGLSRRQHRAGLLYSVSLGKERKKRKHVSMS